MKNKDNANVDEGLCKQALMSIQLESKLVVSL